jgi:hypothetical protein
MKVLLRALQCLLLCLGLATANSPVHAAKLGIITTYTELSLPSDLLTAELSTADGVQLLERAELQKIIKEQSLSAALSKNALKLGELIGADGLIILSIAQRDTNSVLNLRLLAVKPGIVLFNVQYSYPVKEPKPG